MLLFAQHLPFNEHGIFAPFVQAARASLLPTTAAPVPIIAPEIHIWHGDVQRFGHLGRPQPDFNLLGAVTFPESLVALTWSLDGGPPRPLDTTPDRRIARRGDFNAEVPLATLPFGRHTVRLAARWAAGIRAEKTVILDHQPAPAAPFSRRQIRWHEVAHLQDVGQITDGHWHITPQGLRPLVSGYDRVFVIGDVSWRDYEVTGTVTFHDLPIVVAKGSGRVRHAGYALRWQGNSPVPNLRPGQPKHGLHPRGALTWLTYRDGLPLPQREFYPADTENYRAYAPLSLRLGETFRLKTRCVTRPDSAEGHSVTEYSLKAWRDGESEPVAWDYVEVQTSPTALRTGALALVAHEADVTFGDLDITPL
jgi:hypothetical protein